MPRFYFVDTNIVLGRCNPFDRLHPITIPFFDAILNKRAIFLLHSVEKEFYRKIRITRITFEQKIVKKLQRETKPNLEDVKHEFLNDPDNKEYQFEKYIFDLMEKDNIETVSYSSMMKPLSKFISTMRFNFKKLINHWIVRPKANNYQTILSDPQYIMFINKIGDLLHYPDKRHLALAGFVALNRNGSHEYLFYTDDNQFIYNNLERVINLPKFRIKKIQYQVLTSLSLNPKTGRFSIKKEKLEFVPDEDLS